MALPAWLTAVGNTIHTAAQWNSNVRDNGKFLTNPPQCCAYHNATQSIPNAAPTPVALNTERFDDEALVASTIHSTVVNNSRMTPVVAGLYLCVFNLQYAAQAVAAGYRKAYMLVNGATFVAGQTVVTSAAVNATPIPLSCSRLWRFNGTTDYIQGIALHTAGVALNVEASTGYECELTLIRVG